jgi:hypothetical protein
MTTAVTIAPRIISNVMALPSQVGAGVQIERRDGKGRNANRNKDKVEEEERHWMVLLVHRWLPKERHEFFIAKAFSLLNWRNFSAIRLWLRLKMFQASNAAFHIGNGAYRFKRAQRRRT